MSRSALVVAGALFAVGALVWLLGAVQEDTAPARSGSPSTTPADGPGVTVPVVPEGPGAEPAADPATIKPVGPPRIATRDDLVKELASRGLDAERLLAGYRSWRVALGFLGPDLLAGIAAEEAPSQAYAAMDRLTQKALADGGDLGAIQAYAAGSLPEDPYTAIEYYRRASVLGSAEAMLGIADIFATLGAAVPGDLQDARRDSGRVLALRGGDPNRDLTQDAAAWTLAAIRLYGPGLATADGMARLEALKRSADEASLLPVCASSLAILADLSAATAGRGAVMLPPVFVAEKGLYERLPCRDTPAPVTPPRALERCASSPAVGSNNQPVDLWICEEN